MPKMVDIYVGPKTNRRPRCIQGLEGDVTLNGQAPGLGEFKLTVTTGPETNQHPLQVHEVSLSRPLDRTLYQSFQLKPEQVWKTKGKHYIVGLLKLG